MRLLEIKNTINYQHMDGWIDLSEFAAKYGISTSTLRRRIRTRTIEYKLEKGKYLLLDSNEVLSGAPLFSRASARQEVRIPRQTIKTSPNFGVTHQEIIDRLEKENRQLKEQISELETLVRALEGDAQANA